MRGIAIGLAVMLLVSIGMNMVRVPGVAAQAVGPAGSAQGFRLTNSTCDSPDAAHVYVCGSSTFSHGIGVSVAGAAYTDPFVGFPQPATSCTLKITTINADGSWNVAISGCK